MALIKTIQEVRSFLRVNFTNQNTSIPNMGLAAEKYLVPFIGQELYDDLQAKYNDGSNDEKFKKLLLKVQAVLVPMAYYSELPLINTQISDIGLQKMGTADSQPIFKHDFYKVLTMLLDHGSDGMERLLTFLEQNKVDYPLWVDAIEREEYRSLIVRNAREFAKEFSLVHPQRCYHLLRPCIRTAQLEYIIPSIGEEFFAELLSNETPSTDEKKVMEQLRRAVVFLAMYAAPAQLSVQMTAAGFTVQASDIDLAEPSRVAANEQGIIRMQNHVENAGLGALRRAKELLNNMASPSTFTKYFNSVHYSDPMLQKPSINSQLKSTFTF